MTCLNCDEICENYKLELSSIWCNEKGCCFCHYCDKKYCKKCVTRCKKRYNYFCINCNNKEDMFEHCIKKSANRVAINVKFVINVAVIQIQ